ncbi:MAG: hypothetical protein ABJB86_15890, partial [Bacteroidota bacterium]
LLQLCVISLSFPFLNSCIKPPLNFDPRDGNNVYTGCRVKETVNQGTTESPGFTRHVAYNSSNNPISVDGGGSTGRPNLVFKYDKREKLIEYSGVYTNALYEFVHRYGYSNNRIVTDTQYVFGTYGNLTDYQSKRIIYVFYDKLNRVAEDSEVFVYPTVFTSVLKYDYNQDGNFEGFSDNGGLTTYDYIYDNKLNPRRTNKIWMFIDRNYSVNNFYTAKTYNSAGLPLTFGPYQKFTFDMIFASFYYYGTSQITYDCK